MNDQLHNTTTDQNSMDRTCKNCGKKLFYSYINGQYFCKNCDYKEKDTYGRLKTILDKHIDLSRPELADVLDMKLSKLNIYFDENNNLVNPKATHRNMKTELLDGQQRICPYCGTQIYVNPSEDTVCPTCGYQLVSDIKKVKNFLYDNGPAPAAVISMATGVSEQVINQFLEEERIEITEDSPTFLACKTCGAPIRSGKTCPACATKELKKLRKGYSIRKTEEKEIQPQYRFITKRK